VNTIRVAAIQLGVENYKSDLLRAATHIAEAAKVGARLVVLPERFAHWAPDRTIPTMAESVPGPTTAWLADRAREHGVYIVGGSILERAPGQLLPYNTSLLFSPDGTVIARYRKIHLFDALVEGVPHGESNIVAAGDEPVTAATDLCRIGMSICYDLRFPELYRGLATQGADVVVVPAGFTRVTGAAHWEVLLRARAIESQVYVIAACSCGTTAKDRDFFGHSMIVSPWGDVLAVQAEGEGAVIADLDMSDLAAIRARMPVLSHRRWDLRGARLLPV